MTEYAVYHKGRFIAAGTAEYIAGVLKIKPDDVRQMADEDWQKRWPKLPKAYVISGEETNMAKWRRPTKEFDFRVYGMRKQGLSFEDIAKILGITRVMAESSYNRVTNGRWGSWFDEES